MSEDKKDIPDPIIQANWILSCKFICFIFIPLLYCLKTKYNKIIETNNRDVDIDDIIMYLDIYTLKFLSIKEIIIYQNITNKNIGPMK